MIGDTVRFLKDHGKTVIYDAEHSFDGYKDEPEYALARGRRRKRPARIASCFATPTAAACRMKSPGSRALAKGKLNAPPRHPHARRLRRGRGQRPGGHRSRRHPGAGHHQRLRGAHGQLQFDQRHPAVAFQDGKAGVPAKSLPKLKELSEFVDEIANMRHNPRQPWVGPDGVCAQGRDARPCD